MTTQNCYSTLAEFKGYATDRGGDINFDAADDGVIERLLKTASRYLDSKTGRHFTPHIETRYFNTPDDTRVLELDDDLLEVLTLTNGDSVVIPSTEYKLVPKNGSPHYGIRLNGTSTYAWTCDSSGDTQDVITVNGVWGFHDRYALAWSLVTTAAEAMDASETGYDVTSGDGFVIGDLIRFDNELGYVSSVATNTLTITRGENFSTAATHLTAINVYSWQVMDEVKNAVCEIAQTAYKRRFGQSLSSTETITAGGIVLAPRDIPAMAEEFIRTHRRVI